MAEYLISGPVGADRVTAEIARAGSLKNSGGLSLFLGQVREDNIDGKTVEAIEYSAYEPLAAKEAEIIINEIMSEFGEVTSAVIIHSIGKVNAGEISLFVMVSAAHRDQAMNACNEIVERIKQRLPVWKKEVFTDSSHHWR